MKMDKRRKRISWLFLRWTCAFAPILCLNATPAEAQSESPSRIEQALQNPAPQPPPPMTPAARIGKIVISGNKNLNESSIENIAGVKVGDPVTNESLDAMKARLLDSGYFGFNGVADAEAVKVYAEEATPENYTLFINVVENPKVELVQVFNAGPIPVKEIESIVRTGVIFNGSEFVRDMRKVQELYQKQGYVVDVMQDSGPDPDKPGVLNVVLLVARVKEIRIAKNNKTRKRAVLREMRTKEGGYFNRFEYEKDRQRLFNLGIFEEVTPTEQTTATPGEVILILTLPERRTGQLLFGAGFSNRQQFVGFAQIADTNFRGLGETLSLRWESGGIANRSTIDLGFVQPWLDKQHTSLSVNLYDRVFVRFANRLGSSFVGNDPLVNNGDRYFETRTGGQVTVSRPLKTETVRLALTTRAENVRTSDLALTGQDAAILQNGPIGSIGSRLIQDVRDNPFDPVSGSLNQIALEFGYSSLRPLDGVDVSQLPANIFGSGTFVKSEFDVRYYLPIFGKRKLGKPQEDKTTLAMRFLVGFSSGRLPFFEQYFVGGPESLRGYREDRFWGTNRFLFQTELRQPLARSLSGALFVDVGSAWGGPYSNVSLNGFNQSGFRPNIGVGVGLRVRTPFGPLRFDLGYGAEGARTHISFGTGF